MSSRNTSTARQQTAKKQGLKERAAQTRDAIGRFLKRGAGQVTDQPQPASLPEGSSAECRDASFSAGGASQHDAGRGHSDNLDRADAGHGRAPRQEHDMGRHETFENAAPISDELLAGTIMGRSAATSLPAPGSDEAKTAFKAACHEHTIRTQFANEYLELKRTHLEWWTTDSLGKALASGELTPAACARLYPLATERELRMAQIEHELNLGALHALAFAESYPAAVDDADDNAAEDIDGADASLLQLGRQFDAAQAHEMAAVKACSDAEKRDPSGEVPPDLEAAASKAGDVAAAIAAQIAGLLARTAAGFKVKVRALAHYQPHEFRLELPDLPDPDQLLFHSLWRDVQAEASTAEHARDLPDPIFAAIVASRQAEEAMRAFGADPAATSRPGWQQHQDALEAAQIASRNAVWSMVPTTHAGRLALVEYAEFQTQNHFGKPIDGEKEGVGEEVLREVLGALGAAVRAEREVAPHPMIGAIIDGWAAWVATLGKPEEDTEATAAWDRACEHRDNLLDAADALPATIENIIAKALARLWMDWVEDERPGRPRNTYSFDGRLAFDVNAAIMGQVAPSGAVPSLLKPAVSLDLRDASIRQLARFYEHLDGLAHIVSTACNAPMAWDDKRENHNSIGRILEAEHARLDEIAERVTDEIRTRVPANGSQRDDRLATIVKRQFDVFSNIGDLDVLAEIKTAWGSPTP